jgi:Putative general bacterial porin
MATPLRTAYAAALFALASSANGEEFSWQLSGGYGETELSQFADTERTTLEATYYFDPVDDSRGPYALAPFLNRSSRVTGGVMKETTTITAPVAYIGLLSPTGPTAVDVTEDTTGYSVGGRYVWAASGWYVGAAYRDLDTDQEPSSPLSLQGTTSDGYELFGGRYFGESTSLDLTAGTARQTTELTLTCITSLCLSGSAATQIDTDDWSIGALHVRQGSRVSYSIAGRISGTDITPSVSPLVLTLPPGAPPPQPFPGTIIGGISAAPFTFIAAPFTGPFQSLDERKTASIAGELFPTDRIGLRIGLAHSNGEYGDDDSYDVAATWFFTRAAAVEFVLARTQSEIFSLSRDIDSAELRVFGRL